MSGYLGLLDMLNGGGAGKAGDTFEGGIFSGLLNGFGIRPMGAGAAEQPPQQQATGQQGPMLSAPRTSPAQIAAAPPHISPTPLQSTSLSYGMNPAQIPGATGAPLGYGQPQEQAMPDLAALARAKEQERAAAGFDFALRNPTSPAGNAGAGLLSQMFQTAVTPRPKSRAPVPPFGL